MCLTVFVHKAGKSFDFDRLCTYIGPLMCLSSNFSVPLRAKLGTGKPPAKDKGKGRKAAQQDDNAAPTGGMRGKLFRGASSNDVEVSLAPGHASSTLHKGQRPCSSLADLSSWNQSLPC